MSFTDVPGSVAELAYPWLHSLRAEVHRMYGLQVFGPKQALQTSLLVFVQPCQLAKQCDVTFSKSSSWFIED